MASVRRTIDTVARPPVQRLGIALALVWICTGPVAAQQAVPLDPKYVAQRIVADTNELRRRHNQARVEINPQLTDAARYFAGFLSRSDRQDHTADGQRPEDRARQYGYEYCIVSENIAYHFSTTEFSADQLAREFFKGWEMSPGHLRNMLNVEVTQTGVAVARNPQTGYYYAVQMFGRPRSAAIEFSVVNSSRAAVAYTLDRQSFPLAPGATRRHRQCGATELVWQAPDDSAPVVLVPKSGDRYTIVRLASGAWRLRQE